MLPQAKDTQKPWSKECTALPTPSYGTSESQNGETVNFLLILSHFVVLLYGNPRKWIQPYITKDLGCPPMLGDYHVALSWGQNKIKTHNEQRRWKRTVTAQEEMYYSTLHQSSKGCLLCMSREVEAVSSEICEIQLRCSCLSLPLKELCLWSLEKQP